MIAALEALLKRDIEPEELKGLRKRAWEAYTGMPFPDRASHLWRYSEPKEFWVEPEALGRVLRAENVVYEVKGSGEGCRVLDLQEAVSKGLLVVGHNVGPEFGKFEALNLALWQKGFFLEVPKKVECSEPVIIRKRLKGVGLVLERSSIHLSPGASLTLVEVLEGGQESDGYINTVQEVILDDGAELNFIEVILTEGHARVYSTVRHTLGSNSILKWTTAHFGGGILKSDLGALLCGEGASSEIFGSVFGFGQAKSDIHTLHDHASRRTFSNIDLRVVLQEKARSAYTGLIHIGSEALFAEAFQENRNLLLSKESQAESIPELEILTDEVRCKHGVTVGPIESEPLFYLMSRGIPKEDAFRLLVKGFLEPVLGQVPESLRGEIDRRFTTLLKPKQDDGIAS